MERNRVLDPDNTCVKPSAVKLILPALFQTRPKTCRLVGIKTPYGSVEDKRMRDYSRTALS